MTATYLEWFLEKPGVWRSVCGRYAITAHTLAERIPRVVYSVRWVPPEMAGGYPGSLGVHLDECHERTIDENSVFSAEAIAERHNHMMTYRDQLSVPADHPAASMSRFHWPISDGTTRAALAVVEHDGRAYARVLGTAVRDDGQGYHVIPYAEIDLTALGLTGRLANTTAHGADPCSCGAKVGDEHREGCTRARCLWTGLQRIGCGGLHYVAPGDRALDDAGCGRDVHDGRWPGDADCERLGLWCLDQTLDGRGFVPCEPGTPGAVHDLNRLVTDCVWDRQARRWNLPDTPRAGEGA